MLNDKKNKSVSVGMFKRPGTNELKLVVFDNSDALVRFSNEAHNRGQEIYWQGIDKVYSEVGDAVKDWNWD